MRPCATLTANPALDQTCHVESVEPDKKLRCSRPTNEPGGGGINVSRAAHELGLDAPAIWASAGRVGRLLGELLDEAAVPHRPVHLDGMVRQNLTVEEESTGRQFRFAMPGPALGPDAAGKLLTTLKGLEPTPEYLVASGSLPPGFDDEFYARIARDLPGSVHVILDAGGGEPLRHALDAGVYVAKLNEPELAEFAGRAVDDAAACAEAAHEIVDAGGAEHVVVSRAAAGAVLVSDDEAVEVRAPRLEIVSSVGAGDSMVAGFLLGLAEGADLAGSLRYGVAAGSAAVLTPGTGLCRREDFESVRERISEPVTVSAT